MKSINNFLTEPAPEQESQTNEVVGTLIAVGILAFASIPMFKMAKSGMSKMGELWGKLFMNDDSEDDKSKDSKGKKSNDSEDNESNDSRDDKSKDSKENSAIMAKLLGLAKKSNENEKNATEKKKNDAMINLLTACSYDKDGNEIPFDQRMEKMKDMMSPEQFESFKKDMEDQYNKVKDSQDFKDALKKAHDSIKPEEYDQMIKDAKESAKKTLEQVEKEKKEQEDYEKELQELEKKIKGTDDKEEKDKLQQQLQQQQQNPPQSTIATATGVTPSGTQQGSEKKPEDYTDDEIDTMQEELAGLDPEKDKDKIKEKEDLLKSIAKAKGKDENEFVPKVDTGKNGTIYQHKVGPLGGKYKRPKKKDGSWGEWTSESLKNTSLMGFLYERLEA